VKSVAAKISGTGILAAGLLVVSSGCTTSIVPPKSAPDPIEVSVVEYGRHASLVLPEGTGAVEYAYGEWKWFALEQKQIWRVFRVLLCPADGTLGRQVKDGVERRILAGLNRCLSIDAGFALTLPTRPPVPAS
jgi:hypothetical protein